MQSSFAEKWRRLLFNPGLWVFISVTILGVFTLRMLSLSGGLESIRIGLGALAPLFTIPLHIIISVSPIPSDFICVGNGAIYGFWGGAACSWCGWWLAGMICFWIGRRLSIDLVNNAAERLPRLLRRYPLDHPMVLIIARQVPGVGGYITTYGAGAIGVTWSKHLWCSALAIVPGSLLLAAAGVALTRPA